MKKSVPTVPFRRKREQKTDYRKRLNLLKSGIPRLVIRKSNKYIQIQVVEFNLKGDKILCSYNSKNLTKLGWKHSCKNLPAAYLSGLALGKLALEKTKKAIADFGLQKPLKGNNVLYAALKGVIDAGLDVPASDDIFPDQDHLTGKHINEKITQDFNTIKSKL